MAKQIRTISDTALWVAIYRADESDRENAHFKDPYARMLAGERGEDIVQAMEAGRLNSWSFVARTYLFDKFILQQIEQGADMVINLASGLDTRAFRLPLPSKLIWVDIDLHEIIEYMSASMVNEKPQCEYERTALDLSQREERVKLFHTLALRGKKILVISEGLLGYLTEEEVGTLAFDLSRNKTFKYWANDIMSPSILPLIQNEMGSLLEDAGTPLKFAPKQGENFFLIFGWKVIISESKLQTAAKLNRLPNDLLAYTQEPIGPIRNFPWSGVCLFENNTFNI